MTEQNRIRRDAEPAHPVYGYPFEGQVLEASGPDPVKVTALQAAVKLVDGALGYPPDPENVIVAAKAFESYLNGEEVEGG